MALKSWAFTYRDHPIRFEVSCRLPGWSRQRLYIDHELACERRGFFRIGSPLRGQIGAGTGAGDEIKALASRTFPAFGMECHVFVNGSEIQWADCAVQIERGNPPPFVGEDIGIFGVLLAILCTLLIPLFLAVAFAWFASAGIVACRKQKILNRKLKDQGRYLDWEEIESRIKQSPSTLILEANKAGLRAWWTEDDLLALSPLPLPGKSEVSLHGSSHPFVEWCWYHYLSEEQGRAIVIDLPPDLALDFRGYDPAGRWLAKYPQLRVAWACHPRTRNSQTLERYVEILECRDNRLIPELIAAIGDEDRELGELAISALRVIGPPAKAAIPALTKRYFHGSGLERLRAANALDAMGVEGVEVLREASRLSDPWISGPAAYVLQSHAGDVQVSE